MIGATTLGTPVLEVGWAERPLEPAEGSGDAQFVVGLESGVLVAVVDGLGHGAEAAAAAATAGELVRAHATEPLERLVELCHSGLHGTRGVVMSVAVFDVPSSRLTWLGVGNVEGVLIRTDSRAPVRREPMALRGGVLGFQLPPVRSSSFPVSAGDLLVFATDGLDSAFAEALQLRGSAEAIARSVLEQHAKGTDDALVLVARYRDARLDLPPASVHEARS